MIGIVSLDEYKTLMVKSYQINNIRGFVNELKHLIRVMYTTPESLNPTTNET